MMLQEKEINQIAKHVDHTNLNPTATTTDIINLIKEANLYHCASICIPPSYVEFAKQYITDHQLSVTICTVVGFPLGYQLSSTKVLETTQLLSLGADEIDVVINRTDVKNKHWDLIEAEIQSLKLICENRLLKVIIETSDLTDQEKIKLCTIVSSANADYIKTSTGFSTMGATTKDILLFKEHLSSNVKIKASGGIKTLEEMKHFLDIGVDRIGTSRFVTIINQTPL